MKTKKEKIRCKEDEMVFAILSRTVKEFGCRKNHSGEKITNDKIVNACYMSRRNYSVLGTGSENKYYNMSLWPADIGFEQPKANAMSVVFITRYILTDFFEPTLFDLSTAERLNTLLSCVINEKDYCYLIKNYGGTIIDALDKIINLTKIPSDKKEKMLKISKHINSKSHDQNAFTL